MGKIYLKMDDSDSAKLVFKHAVDLEPHFLPARLSLGDIYLKEGNKKKAKLEYRRVLATLKMFPNGDALTPFERQFLSVDAESVKVSMSSLQSRHAFTGNLQK
jgi:tetratricopeptide (TPR) repeat protein